MFEMIERYRTEYHGARGHRIKWVVVHYTGTAAGAMCNARALEKELKPGERRSTHYFVEGATVIATVPEERSAWHVGGPDTDDTPPEKRKKIPVFNGNSIGVDLCERKTDAKHRSVQDRDWYFTDETEATAAELIAGIMHRHGIPLDHVVRHFDVTGKWCPRPFMGDDINTVYKESGNERWRSFKALIAAHYRGME